ncbi:50S ribosomal protein L25 [Candidatus Ecksteinia adelgidicola]|nr:50S ribosomal protein L25 [Candidatus Ecksteinia adelgidicola]
MLILHAKLRKNHGTSTSRRLRIKNKLPAIIYGLKKNSVSIEIEQDAIKNIELKSEFYNQIINLIIENQENKVKVKAIQRHPFKLRLTHIDFIRQ